MRTLPFSVFLSQLLGGAGKGQAYSAWLIGMGAATGDSLMPLLVALPTADLQAGAGANNFGGYSNKALDELVTRASHTLDVERREALQREAAGLAMSDAALIPLHHLHATWAFRKGLTLAPRADGFTLATGPPCCSSICSQLSSAGCPPAAVGRPGRSSACH